MTRHDAILIGAGQRGRYVYGAYARRHPDRLRFVDVVDLDTARRDTFGDLHDLDARHRHEDWSDALDTTAARVAVVATPDRHHQAPAVAALERGFDVLLEKPVAHTLEATRRVLAAAAASAGSLHVAHVLRYTPFFRALHEVVTSGRLGDLVSVEHRENVISWHMAHSFVRGNWARSDESTPMIVQKCCHDFDIMAWNLDSPVERLSSFGSLMHFHPENGPDEATERCLDCPAAPTCPFDGTRIYMNETFTGWPVHVITDDLSVDGRRAALETGPYGRCVYRSGSDVVDNQTVIMELASGATATFVMHGHAHRENRTMRYDGTHGTVRAVFGSGQQVIECTDHRGGAPEQIDIEESSGGHGGGDPGVIEAFLRSVDTGEPSLTEASSALESHLLAFEADRARLEGRIIDVAAGRASR